jgi:hypothetical protein
MSKRWTAQEREWLAYKRQSVEEKKKNITLPSMPWEQKSILDMTADELAKAMDRLEEDESASRY